MKSVCSAFALLLMTAAQWGAVSMASAHAAPGAASSCLGSTATGGPCDSGPVILTASEQAILAKKQVLANEFAQVRAGTLDFATFQRHNQSFLQQHGGATTQAQAAVTPFSCIGGCPPQPSASINLIQQPQTTNYYCGPATASEIFKVRNVTASQSTLAGSSYLKTDQNGGTNWSEPDGSSRMRLTLNALTSSSFYSVVNGPSVADLATDVPIDVYNGWAVAAGIYEPAYGVHLTGHPANLLIKHWIAFSGYSSNGSYLTYADSVYHATKVTWNASVTSAYSTMATSTLQQMIAPYGIVV